MIPLIIIYNPLWKIPSHLKDKNGFVNEIKDIDKVSEETYIVKMNVKSLYTNIPNFEDIGATKRILDERTNKTVAKKVFRRF